MTSDALVLRLPTALTLAFSLVFAACGGEDARTSEGEPTAGAAVATAEAASVPAAAATLGTIRATVDGEERTWYVVAGEAADGPYASGTWLESEGGYIVSVGGLDSENPPVETFSRGGASGAMSLGDYEGGAFTVHVEVAPDQVPLTVTVPGEGSSTVVFTPVFDAEDMLNGLMMSEGVIEVTEISVEGSRLDVRGTFSGTLQPMQDAGDSVTITDGSFEVQGLPSAESITPEGGS